MQLAVTAWDLSNTDALKSIPDQAVIAEDMGFSGFWLPENHFIGTASLASPLLLLAAAAAKTKTIRLGTTSYLLPIRNPVEAAEDVATLDCISNGRLILGIGRGFNDNLFEIYNIDPKQKRSIFKQHLEIMIQAWQGYPLREPAGKEPVYLSPRPIQKPYPPLWQVVDSPRSIEWAANNDIKVIMWIPPVQSLKKRFEIYQNAKSITEKKHAQMGDGIAVVRDMFIADTMDQAREMAGEQMVNYMRWVCHWRGLGTHMNPGEELPKTEHKLDLLSYEFLHERNMLFGTVDYVIEKIEEMRSELNIQNLQVWSNFPGVKHEDCMRSIKLFTEKVMPHFKNKSETNIKQAS